MELVLAEVRGDKAENKLFFLMIGKLDSDALMIARPFRCNDGSSAKVRMLKAPAHVI